VTPRGHTTTSAPPTPAPRPPSRSFRRAHRATRTPRTPRARAVARPMPDEAPVTMATLPERSATRTTERAGDAVAVARHPRVHRPGHRVHPRHAKDRGEPAPPAEAPADLGGGPVAREHAPVGEHELHRRQARRLVHPGVARAPLGGLAGQGLDGGTT